MLGSKTPGWIPVFSCIFLAGVAFIISTCLVLSLIPVYLNSRAVQKSTTSASVYTLNGLSFSIGGRSAGLSRVARDTSASSPSPSTDMITSLQQQLNVVVAEINAVIVVSQALMPSTSNLTLILQLYFLDGCFAYALIIGSTPITLNDDISDINGISSPKQTSIASLAQQGDPCPNRSPSTSNSTSLVYPTDCNATQSSGIVTTASVENGTLEYHCYYFVTSANASSVILEFIFSTGYSSSATILNDVTLNSTSNLIQNGDFEIFNQTTSMNSYEYSSWTLTQCEGSCANAPVSHTGFPNSTGIATTGIGVQLSQTVALNTVGTQSIYRLGYWFECITYSDPTGLCYYTVQLTTT